MRRKRLDPVGKRTRSRGGTTWSGDTFRVHGEIPSSQEGVDEVDGLRQVRVKPSLLPPGGELQDTPPC